ncbi:MAG TPA: DUF1348 family protein [Marmoricola sp.]|nr:DUF1348 family protein [Marmoricola sp.]
MVPCGTRGHTKRSTAPQVPCVLARVGPGQRAGVCSARIPAVWSGPESTQLRGRGATLERRPPVPPFSREDVVRKVRAAEDAWNTRAPQRVALAYSEDSRWRNRRSSSPTGPPSWIS